MENRKKYIFTGAFISATQLDKLTEALQREKLPRSIRFPHVTFAYRPETVDESMFGTEILVRAVGYGSDGANEGLKVELFTDKSELCALIKQIPLPHITLSVGETGQPVNTRFIHFDEITPFEFIAIFGGYNDHEGPVFIPSGQ